MQRRGRQVLTSLSKENVGDKRRTQDLIASIKTRSKAETPTSLTQARDMRKAMNDQRGKHRLKDELKALEDLVEGEGEE